ncbi:MAG: ABC transporter permease [Chloroflexota bacterium]|jgi:peptide/nickel transport system permease protein|nr:ABC transporter permease [Chloroflexota bacterium]
MGAQHAEQGQLSRLPVPEAENTNVQLGDMAALARKSPNMTLRNLRRFIIGNRLNLLGLCLVCLFLFLSLFGSVIAPYDPAGKGDIINAKLVGPSADHLLGTDEQGRDVFSRVLGGARDSLVVALIVLSVSVVIGIVVGAIAGFFGGLVDEILMRLTDMFLAFPALVLAIAIAATLGPSLRNTMLALATVFWPWYARLVRGQVLTIRERDYVDAARAIGMPSSRILAKHIMPNAFSVVIIQLSLDVGYAILTTSSLSFVGLGAQPPSSEWGLMLSTARNYFRDAWWYITFPGIALTLTVFAFNILGDGIQDALDPRSSRR